jgi:hypothetical protein
VNNAKPRFAVNQRAAKVPGDYSRKAHEVDTKFNGTAPGAVGPMETAMDGYGGVHAMAAGHFGEVNKGLDDLLSAAAELGVQQLQDALYTKTPELARAVLPTVAAEAQACRGDPSGQPRLSAEPDARCTSEAAATRRRAARAVTMRGNASSRRATQPTPATSTARRTPTSLGIVGVRSTEVAATAPSTRGRRAIKTEKDRGTH